MKKLIYGMGLVMAVAVSSMPSFAGEPHVGPPQVLRAIRYDLQAVQQGILQHIFLVEDLIDRRVTNQVNEQLGTVENLVISQSGRVSYIILSPARGMVGEGQVVAVPWSAANPSMLGEQVIMTLSQSQVQNAPTISINNLAQLTSPQTQQQINAYFGISVQQGFGQPYQGIETQQQP